MDHAAIGTALALGGAFLSAVVWLLRLEGRINRMDSIIEERTAKSSERTQGLQKQIDEIRESVSDQNSQIKESLSTLIRQVGKLEGMIEVLVDKKKDF